MKALLVYGGRIIDPGLVIDEVGSLLISGGKISWMGTGDIIPPQMDCDVLPAQGLVRDINEVKTQYYEHPIFSPLRA